MFKEIQSGLSKFFGKKWIPIVVIIVICFLLLGYSTSKSSWSDGYTDYSNQPSMANGPVVANKPVAAASVAASADATGYALQPVANPSDLLPKDSNAQWSASNPVASTNIATPDLLSAGYHIGLDTIGQTLKNANLQLRSDPIIQKTEVGPWNLSTIEPNYGQIPLEIGACNQ